MTGRVLPVLTILSSLLVVAGCAATRPAPVSSRSTQNSEPAQKPAKTAPAEQPPGPPATSATPATPATPAEEEAPIVWSWPVKRSHPAVFSSLARGIDFTINAGEPVRAAASGVVSYVGDSIKTYGQMIVIKHSPNYLSVYANDGKILVKEGQEVKGGEKIAETGDPANGKWHFEIRHHGKPVDPVLVLPSGKR